MKKNIFIKGTIILIISGIFTKILGFIIRILYTRMVGNEIIGLHSLVMPTYSLVITFATLAMPQAISKLVAEKKNANLKIISNALVILFITNITIMIILIFSAKFISYNLLHEAKCYYLIIAMALTFPIISLSCTIKGYFYGLQNMMPNAISNIVEQILRIVLIYTLIPYMLNISDILAATSLFIFSFIEELVSIIVNLLFLPKSAKIKKCNLIPDKNTISNILSISLPTVSSRIIGNIGYFFEPIILTSMLLKTGFTNNYIITEYGAYNAYSLTILTVPSFFITAISSSLIPEISKYNLTKQKYFVKRRLKQAINFALIIGISYSILLMLFSKNILYLIYNTTNGLNYIKILAPIFPLFYLENILISFLQAINKANITMKITIFGVIIKLLSIVIFALLKFGMYALIISEIINIIFVILLNIYYIKKEI